MTFLSLSSGDPAARDLLQRAIRARYGLRPVPLESLRLWLKSQSRDQHGLPITRNVTVSYVMPDRWVWDETRTLFGIKHGAVRYGFGRESFYAEGEAVQATMEPQDVESVRLRSWAEITFLLMPLTMAGVQLRAVDDTTFQANRQIETDCISTIHLDDRDSVSVETTAYDQMAKQLLPLTLSAGGGLQTIDGFTLPQQFIYQWGQRAPEIFSVIKAQVNVDIPASTFAL